MTWVLEGCQNISENHCVPSCNIPGLNLPWYFPRPIWITPHFSHLRSEEMMQDGVSPTTQALQGLIAETWAYVKFIYPNFYPRLKFQQMLGSGDQNQLLF
jgi:hypothetical protein